jgi:pyruvate kinase
MGLMKDGYEISIVATLGPASWDLAAHLVEAGATSFRINASHLSAAELGQRASALRAEIPGFPLIVDLQGAKMRVGFFPAVTVRAGDPLTFSLGPEDGAIPLPHPEVFLLTRPGETLRCDDDRLRFRVTSVKAGRIEATALLAGTLQPRKGINVLEHPVALGGLSAGDLANLYSTEGIGGVDYAFSFMSDGSEATWIRDRVPGCRVIGKIERREAMENAQDIGRAVDHAWVCRGDLGAQVGLAQMARWISAFDPRSLACPVLMAGQVLEHMTSHGGATRSEICHLFDLSARGYAGFVLSDETAIGEDPVRAVSTLHRLLTSFQ